MSLQHERTHWFQFSGSTFGAALMTLHRAEETVLMFALKEELTDAAAIDYVRRRVRAAKSVFFPDPADSPVPRQVAALAGEYLRLRTCRGLLTNGQQSHRFNEFPDSIAEALIKADHIYALHTGHVRPWSSQTASRAYQGALLARPASIGGNELSTRNLMEAGAFVNEFACMALTGWGAGIPKPGSPYRSMPTHAHYLVEDALKFLPKRYNSALELALSRWSSHLSHFDGADQFGASVPTLACCIDISLNPPIPPLCEPGESAWRSLYPPMRFIDAVDAVAQLGIMKDFPTTNSYAEYRDRVCEAANLTVAHMTARSFQHPRLDRDFFTTATSDDPLVIQSSSFDYLIWVMESMNEFRQTNPLRWTLPYLTTIRFEDWDVLETVGGEISTAMAAPIFWTGDELGWGFVSPPIARKIAIEKSTYHLLQSAMLRNGQTDLSQHFPLEFLKIEEIQAEIREAAVHLTGVPEFTERALLPKTKEDFGEENGWASRAYEEPRIKGRRSQTFRVRREEVEKADLSRLRSFIEELRRQPFENARSVDLSFDSYNSHPDELWDIPEVTHFLMAVQEQLPHWSWYFTAESNLANCGAFVLIFLTGAEDRYNITMEHCIDWLLEVTGDVLMLEGERAGVNEKFLTDMAYDVSAAIISILRTSFP